MPFPYFENEDVILYHGDCRALMARAATQIDVKVEFDGVITDPPYGIANGAAFAGFGNGILGEGARRDVSDQDEASFNALVLEREWIPSCTALLRDGGYLATFCARQRAGIVEQLLSDCGLTPWMKFYLVTSNPPPNPRHSFMSGVQECVIAYKGKSREWYGGATTPNFYAGIPATTNPISSHPAEKPLGAMRMLVRALVRPGGTVLDPFAGSGTTLRAAIAEGRKAVGIEIEAERCEEIVSRCSQSRRSIEAQPVLF